MRMNKKAILDRITGPDVSEEIRGARELLARGDTLLVSADAVFVTAPELKSLWETRLKIAETTGHPILGAADLVRRSCAAGDAIEIEQYNFSGPNSAGSVFLVRGTGEFFGLVAVASTGNRGTDAKLMAILQGSPWRE